MKITDIHEVNPYKNFNPRALKPDMQTWGGNAKILLNKIDELNPELIVEVGTWKGGSAIHMAKHLKKINSKAKIVCVDTWLGSLEHWMAKDETSHRKNWFRSLKLKNGYPQLYNQFLYNVIHAGLQEYIIPFPVTSAIAAEWFIKKDIEADFIYIDGDHSYNAVYYDVLQWYVNLKLKGHIIGHDIQMESVNEALDTLKIHGLIDYSADYKNNIYTIKKDKPNLDYLHEITLQSHCTDALQRVSKPQRVSPQSSQSNQSPQSKEQ